MCCRNSDGSLQGIRLAPPLALDCKIKSLWIIRGGGPTTISWFEENSMTANPDKFQAIVLERKLMTILKLSV